MDKYEIVLSHTALDDNGYLHCITNYKVFEFDSEVEDRIYLLNINFDELIKKDEEAVKRFLQNG